jgi:hypothetical protein
MHRAFSHFWPNSPTLGPAITDYRNYIGRASETHGIGSNTFNHDVSLYASLGAILSMTSAW